MPSTKLPPAGAEKYSKVKLFLLKLFLSLRGIWRSRKFKKAKTYWGGRNKRQGVYMGKKTFYETFVVSGIGYEYWDSKPIKYKNWELGMWKWQ